MPFYTAKSEADWKRDEEEYRDLNEICDYVRHYSRSIRRGGLIHNIKPYHGELMNYFKWLSPYLKKAKQEKDELKIESLLEMTEVMINRAFSKSNQNNISKDFTTAFSILEQVELELNRLKVNLNMGVSMSYKPDKNELDKQRMRRSAGFD
jgi:hypothetical protein